jgi:drug/metabolite transporter (DMT)-like permease
MASAVAFGVAGFLLGYLAQRAGWVAGLWASRMAQVICYIPLAVVARRQLPRLRDRRGLAIAIFAAMADIVGVIGLSVGSDRGFVSVTIAASAVFPLVAVVLAFLILHERLAPNQLAGIGSVVAGLLLLGFG